MQEGLKLKGDSIKMEKKNSLIIFFRCLIVGFLFSSIKTDVRGMSPLEIVGSLFFAFWYNFTVGIFFGLAGLMGNEIYFYIKKNLNNERYRHLLWYR